MKTFFYHLKAYFRNAFFFQKCILINNSIAIW